MSGGAAGEAPGACPLCKGDTLAPLHRELRDGLGVNRCGGCGLLSAHPYPDAKELAGLYDDSYFAGTADTNLGYESYAAFRPALEATFRRNLRLLRRFVPSGKLLELGSAEGFFLPLAASAGYAAEGIEIATGAAARAAALSGVPVHAGSLDSFSQAPATYDVVAAWDVIEHVADPKAALDRCAELLKPGGWFAATVPDPDGWTHGLLGTQWFGWNALREHPIYFPRATLRGALEERGFAVKLQRRWPWTVPLYWLLQRLPAGALTAPLSKALLVGHLLIPFPWINQIVIAQKGSG
ncbi:MAG: class I SAM-dependent methyltransferase [Planctomycetota bacterium]